MAAFYVVRRRGLSLRTRRRWLIFRQRVPYRRPWEILLDGVPIAFYDSREAAIAACPEKPEVQDAER